MNKAVNPSSSIMSRDFKSSSELLGRHSRQTYRFIDKKAHWVSLVVSVAILASIFFLATDNAKATRAGSLAFENSNSPMHPEQTNSARAMLTLPLAIPGNKTSSSHDTQNDNISLNEQDTSANWTTATVKSGDNLALIFSRQGLSPQELDRLMRSDKTAAILKRLMPGQTFSFNIIDGHLQQLIYKIDALNTLNVKRNADDNFSVTTNVRSMEIRATNTTAHIKSSLFLAGQAAGMSDNLIMELAGIFGWDIDFVLDIRSGDRFTLVYEELYLDGHKQRDGNILAAEFINRGKVFRALRYTDASGMSDYYSPDGKSMRKAFLRTPVDFTRISSRFGKRRHPTLNTLKNHHGVDYAAPRGTPIKAAGDGKMTFVGRKGGYGKTVIIQHGGKYSTLYAHMSRIKPGSRRGKRVQQGQIIGYVGTTGRSTGPHLHYEFRVNGVHRNPLTVRLPDAAPILAKYKSDFFNKSRGLIALLDVLNRTAVALNDRDN